MEIHGERMSEFSLSMVNNVLMTDSVRQACILNLVTSVKRNKTESPSVTDSRTTNQLHKQLQFALHEQSSAFCSHFYLDSYPSWVDSLSDV